MSLLASSYGTSAKLHLKEHGKYHWLFRNYNIHGSQQMDLNRASSSLDDMPSPLTIQPASNVQSALPVFTSKEARQCCPAAAPHIARTTTSIDPIRTCIATVESSDYVEFFPPTRRRPGVPGQYRTGKGTGRATCTHRR
eukprot:scaffold145397_cov27-Prasinocladus_malaysianus.AAC.1